MELVITKTTNMIVSATGARLGSQRKTSLPPILHLPVRSISVRKVAHTIASFTNNPF
jgi:hypothetical protein